MLLETQRLVLREFRREDFQELASILADPEVMRFSPTGILSISETQEKIESFIASYNSARLGTNTSR
jgi:[ribosomal protein S5]-alanine N-acetyltransferase